LDSDTRQHEQPLREGGDYPDLHPSLRPAEPDHPMMLDGECVPGDPSLMMRCLVEEMLQLGMSADEVRSMSHDPNYQALHAARVALGDERIDALIDQTAGRVGRHRHRTVEHQGSVQAVALTISNCH